MVGLVGTLIPLGPGLVALGQGNLAVMAAHLAVAFNVTVVGLCTGALGFLLAGVQRRRDGHDLATLAFIADTLEGLESPEKQSEAATKPEDT
jgi:biopolymer transport protein ExbB/TolQ